MTSKSELKRLAIQRAHRRGEASHQGPSVYIPETVPVKSKTLNELFHAVRNNQDPQDPRVQDLLRDLFYQGLGRTLT